MTNPWTEAVPPHILALADQLSAHGWEVTMNLVSAYLNYCQAFDNSTVAETRDKLNKFHDVIDKTLKGTTYQEVTGVFFSLMHLIYSMLWCMHQGDWEKLHAAAARGELFYTAEQVRTISNDSEGGI